MRRFKRPGLGILAVLLVASLASGGLMGCASTSSDTDTSGTVPESQEDECVALCVAQGLTEGSAEWKECIEECMNK